MGPQIGATRVVMDQMPRAVERFCGGKIEISSACEPGIIGPETPPCRMRKKIRDGRLQATPHRKEATVKASTEKQNVRTTPYRPISQPVNGTPMPLATAKEVITQVPWSDDTPRLPEMVGSETLAMVESSTCMKVPSASTSAVMPSWPPFSGAISAWGAGGRAAAAPCLPSTLPALADIRAVLPQDLGDQGIGH